MMTWCQCCEFVFIFNSVVRAMMCEFAPCACALVLRVDFCWTCMVLDVLSAKSGPEEGERRVEVVSTGIKRGCVQGGSRAHPS